MGRPVAGVVAGATRPRCVAGVAWMLLVVAPFASAQQPVAQAPATPRADPPASLAPAQAGASDWHAQTGDEWLDHWLGDVNGYAAHHRAAFIDEIVRYLGAPRPLLESVLEGEGMAPADLYYACAIAHVQARPCREVVDSFAQSQGAGWQAAATAMGVEPGGAAQSRIKLALLASYTHWARPIVLDASLRRATAGKR